MPDARLSIQGGIHGGLVVYLGSVPIDSLSGLGAEVTVSLVKIERTNAVFAADTLELYSPVDPIDDVVTHGSIVVLCSEGRTAPRWAVEGNLRSPHLRTAPITLGEIH
jgi:hypothetical protein